MEREPPEYDLTQVERISPLDRLYVPPSLNGEKGTFRMSLERCSIEANTDLDAIKLWLSQYDSNSSTFRSYTQSVERLINWALFERRKPLSSLDESDFFAFTLFLSDPQPNWKWISAKSTSRSDINWTPLIGSLSPKSILYVLITLRVMCKWLWNVGYCDIGRSLLQHSYRPLRHPSALILSTKRGDHLNTIRFDDWQLLRQSLYQGQGTNHSFNARMLVELMYYGSLNEKEIAEICIDDLVVENGVFLLEIRSRPKNLSWIYLVPPLAKTIGCALEMARTRHLNLSITNITGDAINAENSRSLLVSVKNIGKVIKRAISRAAKLAASEGDSVASDRIMKLSPHRLCHTFEAHAETLGATTWIWPLIGAASLLSRTTRRYLPERVKLNKLDLEKAFYSLSICWGDESKEPWSQT